MRFQIILCADQLPVSVPINYNWHVASMIYATLVRSSPEFAAALHNDGYAFGGKRFKLFTFSQLSAPRRSIAGGRLHIQAQPVSLTVSSPVVEFMRHLMEGFLRVPEVRIDDTPFRVVEIREMPEPEFQENTHFVCLSPMSVSTHINDPHLNSLHYCRLETGFYEKVVENLRRKYTLLTGQEADGLELRFSFDQRYIDEHGGRITKLVDYKGTKIFGYMAPFTAVGSPELMRIGYECGFGDGNSKGLGMVRTDSKSVA